MKALIRELDRVFSIYIRLRDTNENGAGRCISCNNPVSYSKMNAGHYISRNIKCIRWSEVNVNGQCVRCNMFYEGNIPGYREGMIKKYGQQTLNDLELARHKTQKISRFELYTMIGLYKKEARKLLEGKNFTIKI
ncbi:recombinase [Candidatus Poribacteria bacterium]|nr:recombinase [Candidatus Poribacteria bacterium]